MLSRSMHTYDQITEKNKPVFFDRGIPELIGYCHLIKTAVPDYLYKAAQLYCYNKKVFITPPWKEIYSQDEERKQSWEEARETYHQVTKSYKNTGYQLIEVPLVPVLERVNFIIENIDHV